MPIDLAAAQTWFERAARKGHVDAQATLGLLLFQNGNRVGGLRWLKAAAEQGEPRALLIYGTALFNGDGVVRDPVLAYAYVSRAAAQGLARPRRRWREMDKIMPLEQPQKGVALAHCQRRQDRPRRNRPRSRSSHPRLPKPAPPAVGQAIPKPKPAPCRCHDSGKDGAWRIQLGAFSKRTSAEALFQASFRSGALAGRQPFYVAAGRGHAAAGGTV